MKRLTLDLYRDGSNIHLDIWHPLQDKSQGYRATARNSDALIEGVDKTLAQILSEAPDVDQAEALKIFYSNDWAYVHQSKLQAYDVTIEVLNERIRKLEGELQTALSSNTSKV